MVTFAQAQEHAEEWVNGDVPSYQHREVRVREFELGFVVWAEDRAEGPRSDGGAQRLVLARDSGEATLWPALPVGEVIRRYEEEYGRAASVEDAVPAPPARVDLNQTSFLLTPPEWLQEAADKLGIQPDRTSGGGAASVSVASSAGGPVDSVPPGATPWTGTDTTGVDAGEDRSVPLPATVFSPPLGDEDRDAFDGAATPGLAATAGYGYPQGAGAPSYGYPQGAPGAPTPPARALAPNAGEIADAATSKAPPPRGARAASTPPPPGAPGTPGARPGVAPPGPPGPGSAGGYVPTQFVSALNAEGAEGVGRAEEVGGPLPAGGPIRPGAPAGGVHQAATMFSGPGGPGAAGAPQPPAAPGVPGAGQAQGASGGSGRLGVSGAPRPPGPPNPPGAPLPPGPPGVPGAPGASNRSGVPHSPGGTPPDGVHQAATMFADPQGGANVPRPPGAPGNPGAAQPPGASGARGVPSAPGAPQPPGVPGTPGAVHHAETVLAGPPVAGPGMPPPPPAVGAPAPPGPPNAPGFPGAPGAAGASGAPGFPGSPGAQGVHGAPGGQGAPGAPGGYPPTPGAQGAQGAPGAPGAPGFPGGSGAPGVPGAPPGVPRPPGSPGATPPPPGGRPVPGMPAPGGQPVPGMAAPGFAGHPQSASAAGFPPPPAPNLAAPAGPQSPSYGYPPPGQPTVGPGYQAVLRYRAPDGSEQQVIRRSAPGTPHPEWQIFHELRAMSIPPDQVLELHTELESCELPGAYCARMIREQWPNARITSIAPYGTDHASRQQGMGQLLAHQGELHQVADGPARPGPVRTPLPPVQPAPPIPPEGAAQELAGAFGPGVFRFDQAAVSRQGVPPIVAHTLVVAGLPTDMGPFFWAQAQPGRPVPTLAELAQERGVRPASDAGSYLVMGSDFGKAICVQYGTANIVAVPVEAGPGGAPVPPQFVNTGLLEFTRCLALLGRMWRLRYGLNQEQAGRWTVDFQAQLASLDAAALGSPESWWAVLLEQMWDGLL
ncbi:SUKH-4 family immunity protein [Streptomyces sp. WI04-05B]|uniref:SUKH-4 family immunity protein n=1 Tax=Streptomyces TaxID=1883 RepID=UPI0029A70374|nr:MULTISPECIES: SUKH-4 family immunity protein [unclassified Streptomyces]MDX2544384.1 SUKH-4 family immunity protein [Streptomyces sp. WI04-05B]MDX2588547.1 SUKH-4 family immunity protein [Streptomyces sp. WI04-05A]MDX3750525.1 SUKH-4 family immunity protein [Streptomyces sp. AK08-02]